MVENHHVENHFLLAYLLLEPQEQNLIQAENETKGQEHEVLEVQTMRMALTVASLQKNLMAAQIVAQHAGYHILPYQTTL